MAGEPEPLTITAGGVTVRVRPLGWLDMVEIPDALRALRTMPTETDEDVEAFRDAIVAFGHRIDAYAAGDVRPSMVPPVAMGDLIGRWVSGVRDAALPPAPAGDSPSPVSTQPRAARTRSRPRSAPAALPGVSA
jgi:hypothetical protein